MDRNNAPGSSSSSRDRELYLSNLSNFLNSHQEPTVPGRIVQNLPEHSQDLPRSFNTGPGVHIAPAPSRNDGFPANSVAAHDAGTCGCESMNSINERLRKMARELKWDEATIEEHANNINQINRNTHPVGSEQPMTRRSAVDSQVLSQPESIFIPTANAPTSPCFTVTAPAPDSGQQASAWSESGHY